MPGESGLAVAYLQYLEVRQENQLTLHVGIHLDQGTNCGVWILQLVHWDSDEVRHHCPIDFYGVPRMPSHANARTAECNNGGTRPNHDSGV